MWLTFDKIDADILIDCRNLDNSSEIMPTYKLAMELNIVKKLVFHIDKLFFGFYFLQNLSYLRDSAVIYTDKKVYYISKKELNNSIKIEKIILGKIDSNIKLDWIVNKTDFTQNGLGAIKFKEGYIIVKK